MNNYVKKSFTFGVCFVACLALLTVAPPVHGQSSLGLSIRTSPTTTSPGTTVGVFAIVTNNTSSKIRTTVNITSLSACGIETNIGYTRLALNPGQSMQVTVSYPLPPDACLGLYEISVSASSGGKNATVSSATTYLTVQ